MSSTRPSAALQPSARGGDGERARRLAFAAVAALSVFAAALRFADIDALLPQILSRDGLHVVLQAEHWRAGTTPSGFDRQWGAYPHLLAWIVSLFPLPTAEPGAALDAHLACARAPWIVARLVNSVAAVSLVPGTYLLARHFLDRTRAVLASGFVATSFFLTYLTVDERPHSLATATSLFAVLAALRLARRGTPSAHVGAAVAGAAAIAALHNGAAALLAILWARWIRRERAPVGRIAGFGLIIAAAALAVWIFYPFLRGPDAPAPRSASVSMRGQNVHLDRFGGHGFEQLADMLWWYDPLLALLAVAGGAWLLFRGLRAPLSAWRARSSDLGIVLAFAVPFLLVFGLYDETAGRYVMPLVPVIACAAASILPRSPLALLLLVPTAVVAVRASIVRARPDTLEEAANFVAANIAPAERVAVLPEMDLPLATEASAQTENCKVRWRAIWTEYQARQPAGAVPEPRFGILQNPLRLRTDGADIHNAPLTALERSGVRYVLIDTEVGPGPQFVTFVALRNTKQLLRRFSPFDPDDPRAEWSPKRSPLRPFRSLPLPFQVWRMRAVGPTLELYRL